MSLGLNKKDVLLMAMNVKMWYSHGINFCGKWLALVFLTMLQQKGLNKACLEICTPSIKEGAG